MSELNDDDSVLLFKDIPTVSEEQLRAFKQTATRHVYKEGRVRIVAWENSGAVVIESVEAQPIAQEQASDGEGK